MIRRTLDASFLNSVANHPEVLPWIGATQHPVDVTGLVSNPANVALVTDHGGWIFACLEPGLYELHTMFLPEGRGLYHAKAGVLAMRYLFTRTDAVELLTKVPDSNPRAIGGARHVGFKERFRREGAWTDGSGVSFQGLTIEDWRQRDQEVLAAGQWFHERLDELIDHEAHPEDEAHDRAVGAAVLMARVGALSKGVAFYNRWARFAGYVEARQIGPNAVDFEEAVIEIFEGELSVILHRRPAGG